MTLSLQERHLSVELNQCPRIRSAMDVIKQPHPHIQECALQPAKSHGCVDDGPQNNFRVEILSKTSVELALNML